MMDHSYNPLYAGGPRRGGGLRFSSTEVQHLAGAVAILTLAFGFVLGRPLNVVGFWLPPVENFLAAFIAVGSGFVLHELGHKVVAQAYGHWAEFRAQFSGLGLSLAIAAFLGILFAAPGAVMIMGRVTTKENGYISIIGPGINFAIALVSVPVAMAFSPASLVFLIFSTVAIVNAILCVFNLLPIGPLDGRKVWHWSPPMWIGSMALGAALAFLLLFTNFLPKAA